MKRRSLFARYWLVLSALFTAVLVAGGVAEIAFAYRENVERIAAIQAAEVRLVAGRVGQALADLERAVRDTALLPWHPTLLGMEDARQEFQRLLKVSAPVYEVRGYGADGKQTLRVSRIDLDRVLPPQPAPAVGAGAAAESGYRPIHYRKGSEPFTTLRISLAGPNNVFAAIEAEINLKFAGDVIREVSSARSRNVYLLDTHGDLVAHTDPMLPLRRMSFASLPHVVAARSAGAKGGDGFVSMRSTDHLGADVMVSGMPIGASGWTAFVEEPRERVLEGAWSTARRTGLLVIGGLLAAVLASLFLARQLSRPILKLQEGADLVARGNLDARIDVRTGDEIQSLADKFNEMARQLQEYTTGLERKVDEKTAMLQEAMRARALFLAAASHDLRQPLYAISILGDAIASHDLPAEARSSLAKQREAIAVLRGLFDNLLDLSRFEAGEVQARIRPTSIREALLPLAAEYEAIATAKGLKWHCEVDDAWAATDPELLRRLVSNLLSNAVRYTHRGEVRLIARIAAPAIELEVTDTGIGIAPEFQERVFEEFVQLENPGRDRDRGVGLGLSIVKKVSQLLDAKLRLESSPGVGTRVRFQVPLAEPLERARPPYFAEEIASGGLAGLRVWVLDDDRLVREALAAQFTAWNVDYAFATSRAELEQLRVSDGEWPDAVILDDQLAQGERGLEIARGFAAHMPASRIMIVTGNVDPAAVAELAGSGFHVLRKPIASAVLAQSLMRAAVPPSP